MTLLGQVMAGCVVLVTADRRSAELSSALTRRGATVRHAQGRSIELSFDPRVTSAHQLIAHVAAKFDVEDVHLEEPPIEEVIARFYALHSVDA